MYVWVHTVHVTGHITRSVYSLTKIHNLRGMERVCASGLVTMGSGGGQCVEMRPELAKTWQTSALIGQNLR